MPNSHDWVLIMLVNITYFYFQFSHIFFLFIIKISAKPQYVVFYPLKLASLYYLLNSKIMHLSFRVCTEVHWVFPHGLLTAKSLASALVLACNNQPKQSFSPGPKNVLLKYLTLPSLRLLFQLRVFLYVGITRIVLWKINYDTVSMSWIRVYTMFYQVLSVSVSNIFFSILENTCVCYHLITRLTL